MFRGRKLDATSIDADPPFWYFLVLCQDRKYGAWGVLFIMS